MDKRKMLLYLAVILLITTVLRFYGLAGRGLFYGDETRYYRDAARVKASVTAYWKGTAARTIRGFLGALSVVDKCSFAGKPGHSALGVIGLFMFGDHQHSVLFISALLGIATVALVFLIGYRFYNTQVGLISALILSVCPTHVLFSRSFLTHSNQAFFLMLAVYLYLISLFQDREAGKKRGAPYILSALCMGYAFLVHPTGLIYFAPFLLLETSLWFRKKRRFKDILIFCLLFLIPFFATAMISIFGKKEFGSLAVALKDSYAEQLIFTHGDAAYRGIVTNKNIGQWHYLIMSWLSNGAVFTIVLVLSVSFCLWYFFKKRGLHNFIILVVPFLFYIYWQFIAAHERLFREIVFLFPFLCIMAGVFISKLNKKIAAVLISALVLQGAWYSARVIVSVKSDYPKVEKFLADNKIDSIVTPSEYLTANADVLLSGLKDLKFYLVSNIGEAKNLMNKEGTSYIVTLPGDWLQDKEFGLKSRPLMQVPEPSFAYFPSFYEIVRAHNKEAYLKYWKSPDDVSVSIYDLRREGYEGY